MNINIHEIKYCFVRGCFLAFIVLIAFISVMVPVHSLAQSKQPTLKELVTGSSKEEAGAVEQQKPAIEKLEVVQDEFERGTPLTSFKGFLKATEERDYEKAVQYLDIRRLPKRLDKRKAPELARHLKIVLNRMVWIDLETLSDDPKGHLKDGLPTYREQICRIKTPEEEVDVLMRRIPRGDGTFIWKFSSATVAKIPHLYKHYGYNKLDKVLPEVFFDLDFIGIQLWMWISVVVLLVVSYLIAFILTVLFTFMLSITQVSHSKRLNRFIALPIRFFLTILIARATVDLIKPSPALRALSESYALSIIVFTWVLMGLLDYIFDRLNSRFSQKDQRSPSGMLLPPIRNAVKILIILIAGLVWLDNIGFQVTTLLAGLGVGSIAVALAAQKSIENLIGAITLYTSRPVCVGDFCKFGDILGTVEEIGLRATRIRTLNHSIVSVPNAEFINLHLDNFTQRKKILYFPKIRLRYETSPDQVRDILDEIKKLLSSHPKVLPDPARVRFTSFGAYSLDLEIFAYIDETDYNKYLKIAEGINLQIMDIVSNAGSSFALPSQTTYLESGVDLDKDLKRTAEKFVRAEKSDSE